MKKRRLIGLAAVTVAIWLSSFNLRQNNHLAQYYWFNLDPGTGFAEPMNILLYQSGCPTYCGNFSFMPFCMGGYTGYTGTGPYYATGIEVWVEHDYPHFPLLTR
ncbi:MAG TPA: hypothetical protein VG101_10175 [Puia sp.]|jgi:hypothetical protein|nr:hypothetical protein [Puia sp.]